MGPVISRREGERGAAVEGIGSGRQDSKAGFLSRPVGSHPSAVKADEELVFDAVAGRAGGVGLIGHVDALALIIAGAAGPLGPF